MSAAPALVQRERIRLTGIDWLLTCEGEDRGPVAAWGDLGLRGPCDVVLERAGPAAPWTLEELGDPGFQRVGPPAETARTLDLGGVGLTPAWVDAHTHAVFAGDRAAEFNQRLAGRSYAEIAAEGGGILRTMTATRAATTQQLVDAAAPRLREMAAWGARIVEIKTGYGLDVASEVRLLRAIGQLAADFQSELQLVATAMPGHAVPPEFKADPDRYVSLVCEEILPAMAASGVACPFVDVFVEGGYFNVAQAERIASAGAALGMALKAHVDEFADIGGLRWAVERGAVSVEHLLVTKPEAMAALAASETTAVCLPLTSVFLREGFAPMRALVDAGCRVAVATECNPGSAMSTNLHLALQMAVLGGGLTPQEALRGVTVGGAAALAGVALRGAPALRGHGGPIAWDGRLRLGGEFRVTALRIPSPDQLFYELGAPPRAVSLPGFLHPLRP